MDKWDRFFFVTPWWLTQNLQAVFYYLYNMPGWVFLLKHSVLPIWCEHCQCTIIYGFVFTLQKRTRLYNLNAVLLTSSSFRMLHCMNSTDGASSVWRSDRIFSTAAASRSTFLEAIITLQPRMIRISASLEGTKGIHA